MTLFGLKRIEAVNVIFFSFFIQSIANREALQAANEKRHKEAEERKEQQRQAADKQTDEKDTPATTTAENNTRRPRHKKQLKPMPRKRRLHFIALVDNNFGVGNIFLTLDLSDEVIERAEQKLKHFLDALEIYYRQLGIEFKWICSREFGKKGTKRKHFHLILSGTLWTVDIKKIKKMWKYGKVEAEEITKEQIDKKRAELRAEENVFAKDLDELYTAQGECYVEEITRVEGALAIYLAKDFNNSNREYRMRTFSRSSNLVEPDIETEYRTAWEFNDVINAYREGGEKKVRDLIEDACNREGVNYIVPDLPFVRDSTADDPRPPYVAFTVNKGVTELNRHSWDRHTPLMQDIIDRDIDENIEPILK